jgi:hypothetical protein
MFALARVFRARNSGVVQIKDGREAEAPFRPVPNSLRPLGISLAGQ